MLRETLKQEIDRLSDNQLQWIAEFVVAMKTQAGQFIKTVPLGQRTTPVEHAQDFRSWVAALPKMGVSLPDDAFDRESIYG